MFDYARQRTNLLLEGLLRLNVIFLQLVVQLLQSLKIFDGDPHLLDFLYIIASMYECRGLTQRHYLAEHKIPLRELHEHLFRPHGIVEL